MSRNIIFLKGSDDGVYHSELLGFFFWTSSIVRYSRNQKTERFGNCYMFPSPGERRKTPTQLGPLERPNLNLVSRIPDDGQVQKPSNSEHNICMLIKYLHSYTHMIIF
jgi:hypothetical protein